MATVLAQLSHEQGTKMSIQNLGSMVSMKILHSEQTDQVLPWQRTRASLYEPQASRAKPRHSHQGGKEKAVRSPPLTPPQYRQAQVADKPEWQLGEAWTGLEGNRGHVLTWSPWKGIPGKKTFELKSQSIEASSLSLVMLVTVSGMARCSGRLVELRPMSTEKASLSRGTPDLRTPLGHHSPLVQLKGSDTLIPQRHP